MLYSEPVLLHVGNFVHCAWENWCVVDAIFDLRASDKPWASFLVDNWRRASKGANQSIRTSLATRFQLNQHIWLPEKRVAVIVCYWSVPEQGWYARRASRPGRIALCLYFVRIHFKNWDLSVSQIIWWHKTDLKHPYIPLTWIRWLHFRARARSLNVTLLLSSVKVADV